MKGVGDEGMGADMMISVIRLESGSRHCDGGSL